MKKGQKFLVIRYADNIVDNCIDLHREVLEKIGFCWFGKIGTSPSKKILSSVLEEEIPIVVLYKSGEAYECKLLECSEKKPDNGFPEYYKQHLFEASIKPSSYYKLGSIERLSATELGKCIVVSSRNQLTDTLHRSMASFFYAEFPGDKEKIVQSKPEIKKVEEKILLGENDCKYRKSGKCTLKSCINYLYDCDRPSMCLKQKR